MMKLFSRMLATTSVSAMMASGMALTVFADDFVVDSPSMLTNGGFTIDGDDSLTITEDGSIDTIGVEGVVSVGGFNEILNQGTVHTQGNLAFGIYNFVSDNSPVNNSGTVHTEGDDALGIFNSISDDSPITNSGTVHTEGNRAYGITNNVTSNSPITNSGAVRTEGDFARGIFNNQSTNSPVTNSRSVHTDGLTAFGIMNDSSSYSPITNAGTVHTEGDFARGIYNFFSDHSPITNSGSVHTKGVGAIGIYNLLSDDSPITNSGTVHTEGADAVGIWNRVSDNSPVTNSGSVHTEGDDAFGIYNLASDNSPVTNSGKVHTEGDDAIGIFNRNSDNSPITNTGTVYTEGDSAYGIRNGSSDSLLTNSGKVHTTGIGAVGILTTGNTNSPVTNRGYVVSEQSDAIRMQDTNGVLNLEAPGFIGGVINFVSDTTVNLVSGPSHSVLWDLSTGSMIGGDPASFSGPVPWFYDSTSKQYATYDPTGLAASVNGLGDMASLLSMVGRNGLGNGNGPSAPSTNGFVSAYLPAAPQTEANQRIEQAFADSAMGTSLDGVYAADLSAADMAYSAPGQFWITGFGGDMTHDGDGMTLDHDIAQMGVAAGYTWQQGSGLTLGVMAGYLESRVNADSRFANSHDIDSHGWFAGLYGEQAMGAFTLDFGINGGMLSHDSSRLVNDNLAPLGVAHAKADYDSWFISPEAGISTDISTGSYVLTPSARIRYARQSIDGYTETGTNANAIVGSRDIAMVEAIAEIAARKQFDFGTLTGRLGYLSRHATGDNTVSITMLGINNSVGSGDTDSEVAYLGLGADINLGAYSKLVLDGTLYYSGDMQGVQGLAKFVASF